MGKKDKTANYFFYSAHSNKDNNSVYIVHYTLYIEHCTVYSVQYDAYIVRYSSSQSLLGSYFSRFSIVSGRKSCGGRTVLLCTLPGRRPGIAEGNERTRAGRVHLYFFRFCTNYCVVGY